MWKAIPLWLLLSICAGVPVEYSLQSIGNLHTAPDAHKTVDYYAPAKYEFSYGVKDGHTGDMKSQHEVRDGDVVKGSYSVDDPDGTTRTVHYTADDHNGFNAVVERSGHAQHPQQVQHVAKAVVAAPKYAHVIQLRPVIAAAPAVKTTILSPVAASYVHKPAVVSHDHPHGYKTTVGLGAYGSSGYYH